MPAPMTPAAALAESKRIAATGIFLLGFHAIKRMGERNVTRRDIQVAILSTVTCEWQEKEQTWILRGGKDKDGDDLSVSVTLTHGMMVVTIF